MANSHDLTRNDTDSERSGKRWPPRPTSIVPSEPRKRWIVRMMISYALLLWLVVQACDVTFPILSVPDSVMRGVVFVGLASLPVALAASWCLGLIRDRRGMAPEVDEADAHGRLGLGVVAGLVLGACMLALLVVMQIREPSTETAQRHQAMACPVAATAAPTAVAANPAPSRRAAG